MSFRLDFYLFRFVLPKLKIPSSDQSEGKRSERKKNTSSDFWFAVIAALIIHGVAGLILGLGGAKKSVHPISRPLEAILLSPSQLIPSRPFPPTPIHPKVVRLIKPEFKPLPPSIQPIVTPVPEPEGKSEEQPVPGAPLQEVPLPVASPGEETVVLPEYHAGYLHNMAPSYPLIAKRMKIEGTVRVRVLISPSGFPQQLELEHSSGFVVLDEAAMKAVRGWSFIPARKGMEAVSSWVEIPINFKLQK